MVPVLIDKQPVGAVVCSSIVQSIKDVSACRDLSVVLGVEKKELEDTLTRIPAKSKEAL